MTTYADLLAAGRTQDQCVDLAQKALAGWWRRNAASLQPEEMRDALIDLVPKLADRYGEVASVAAVEWYDGLRAKAVGLPSYESVIARGMSAADVQREIRAMAGDLWGDDPEATMRAISRSMGRWVKSAPRNTIVKNARRDPARPTFARVPSPGACEFCRVMGSRGFAYHSREAAGEMAHFHNDCSCQIVPKFPGQDVAIPGYDPDALMAEYEEARRRVIDAGRQPTLKAILADMRETAAKAPGGPAQWPGGQPRAVGGQRPYPSLATTPRLKGRRGLASQLRKVNVLFGVMGRWPEIFGARPYNVNCVRCVTAYGLRVKGYNVVAGAGEYIPKRLPPGGNNADEALSRWIGPDGAPLKLRAGLSPRGNASDKATVAELEAQPIGSWGAVVCEWKPRGRERTGHIWMWERRADGIHFLDPQNGREPDVESYMSKIRRGTLRYARLDTARPTDALLDVVSVHEPDRRS